MKIEEIEEDIIEEFSMYDDWMDKYAYLIELGNEVKAMPDEDKNEGNLIRGCQSQVWFKAEKHDGRLWFTADSDAVITKGLAALLLKVFSGQTPEDILSVNLKFIDKIGLLKHLSPTRSNGLVSMIKQIKIYALAFSVEKN